MPMSITFKAGWPEPMREWPWFISHNAYYVKKRRQRRGPLRRLVWIWLWIKSCLPQRDHPTDTEIAA